MAVEAAKCALAQRGIDATEIDAIIVCTVTPDHFFPSTACLVQNRIGAKGAWGFDLIAACSSFVYGLTTGMHLVAAGTHKKVLVNGADTMSRIIDYTDRTTCVLFGDGAGAMLLEPSAEGEDFGFIDFLAEIDGSGAEALKMPAGGSRRPPSHETVDQRLHYVHQDGQQVFKYAVRKMFETCRDLLKRNGLTGADVAKEKWAPKRDPYLLETSVPGIFACGDVRASPVKRVASAVGEGSMAVAFVHQYLAYHRGPARSNA
jgi:3-oxoacyl-[acyl-carrier-protein] synthase-3